MTNTSIKNAIGNNGHIQLAIILQIWILNRWSFQNFQGDGVKYSMNTTTK